MVKPNHELYKQDFYSWAMHTASLLRQGEFNNINIEDVAEEIESMGRSDKRQLINRLALLIAHLLKWQVQPERRGNSWKYTIKEQRFRVRQLLNDSPSLKHEIEEISFKESYEEALILTAKATGITEDNLPKECPFSLEQCLNEDYLPD